MAANEVQTRTSTYRLDADGIIHAHVAAGADEYLADAQENIRACATLGSGQRRAVLINLNGLKSQDRAARLYYSGPETAQVVSALALVSNSRLSTIIANFFLAITKGSIPTRLFTDETEALIWLKGLRR